MNEKLRSLIDAAKLGDITSLKRLITDGVNLNQRDASGNQAIHFAAINGKNQVISTLLETGKVCINSDGFHKYTALHYATACRKLSTIEFLVEKNCDSNAVDKNNETCLHFAFRRLEQCKHLNNICPLVKELSDCVKIRKLFYRQSGKFTFHCAMSAVAEYLIKRGKADLFILNNDNETPLNLVKNISPDSHGLILFFERMFDHSKLCDSLNQIQTSIQLLHLSSIESEGDAVDADDADEKINSKNELSISLKRKESNGKIGSDEIERLKKRIEYLESHLRCNECKRMKTVRFWCGHEFCDECFEKNGGNCGLCEELN